MDIQKKLVERNGSATHTTKGLVNDAGQLGSDLLNLVELQSRLFMADVTEFSKQSMLPGLILASGVCLALSSIPIALISIALLFQQTFATSYATAFLIVAILSITLSATLCLVGGLLTSTRLTLFERSRKELNLNMCLLRRLFKDRLSKRFNRNET